MRSDLVFVASGRVESRFLLCHLVRLASRRFHKAGAPIQETINKVLGLVSEQAHGTATVDNKADWERSFRNGHALRSGSVSSRRLPQKANAIAVAELGDALQHVV